MISSFHNVPENQFHFVDPVVNINVSLLWIFKSLFYNPQCNILLKRKRKKKPNSFCQENKNPFLIVSPPAYTRNMIIYRNFVSKVLSPFLFKTHNRVGKLEMKNGSFQWSREIMLKQLKFKSSFSSIKDHWVKNTDFS